MVIQGKGVPRLAACAVAFFSFVTGPAGAEELAALYPEVRELFPQATRFGELEGDPPAAAVHVGERLLGYVFLSRPIFPIPGYSGKPINNLIGVNTEGRITGVRIVEHEEPILVIGVKPKDLERFVAQYGGKSAFDRIAVGGSLRKGDIVIDSITGASITAMVENATVMRSAGRIAAARGLGAAAGAPPPAPSARSRAAGAQTPDSLWVDVWRQRTFQIVVLSIGLFVLTTVLVFQDWLTRRPKILHVVRNGFLLYTVVFIGWYALAQLSVFNILTFVHGVLHDFRWETFLINPMIFILWAFVAVTLLLWGRGVFCGWLCPFGALQELVQQLAQRLRIRQFEFPEVVHERLWALKYILLLALFGVSLQSLGTAARYIEVEPFKTAITMHFQREWTYVLYAGALIAIATVNRKFYCKYLCALGAGLAIAGRFAIFDWLRRHRECGRPCQICALECPSRAIRHGGEINEAECHYCLDCQVTYWNVHRCPPMAHRLHRREPDASALAQAFRGFEGGKVRVAPPEPTRRESE